MHYIKLALFTYTSIHVAIHTTHAYVYFHGWAHLWMTECMVARVHWWLGTWSNALSCMWIVTCIAVYSCLTPDQNWNFLANVLLKNCENLTIMTLCEATMLVAIHKCMHQNTQTCMQSSTHVPIHSCMNTSTYATMHIVIHVRAHRRIHARMLITAQVCIHAHEWLCGWRSMWIYLLI